MILQGVTRCYSTHLFTEYIWHVVSTYKSFKGEEASRSEVFSCCLAGDHSGLCVTSLLAFSPLLWLLLLELSWLNTTLVIRSQLCFKSSSFFLQNLNLAPKVLCVRVHQLSDLKVLHPAVFPLCVWLHWFLPSPGIPPLFSPLTQILLNLRDPVPGLSFLKLRGPPFSLFSKLLQPSRSLLHDFMDCADQSYPMWLLGARQLSLLW